MHHMCTVRCIAEAETPHLPTRLSMSQVPLHLHGAEDTCRCGHALHMHGDWSVHEDCGMPARSLTQLQCTTPSSFSRGLHACSISRMVSHTLVAERRNFFFYNTLQWWPCFGRRASWQQGDMMPHSILARYAYPRCPFCSGLSLLQVLPNHMVFSDLTDEALDNLFDLYGSYLETDTAVESTILINLIDEAIFIQSEGIAAPGAEVLVLGIPTCAGPIHIIDRVLLPTLPNGSVVDLERPDAENAVAPISELFPDLVIAPGPVSEERSSRETARDSLAPWSHSQDMFCIVTVANCQGTVVKARQHL